MLLSKKHILISVVNLGALGVITPVHNDNIIRNYVTAHRQCVGVEVNLAPLYHCLRFSSHPANKCGACHAASECKFKKQQTQ